MTEPLSAPHAAEPAEVLASLDSDLVVGLGEREAAARLASTGPNRLPQRPPPTRLALLGHQLANAMVVLLAVAAIISVAIGELLDAAVIGAIVAANTVLGYVQEGRATEALKAVRKLLSPMSQVLREGAVVELDAERLVPGDVVLLRAGDRVPADGRLLSAARVEADESILTGESLPTVKRVSPPAEPEAPLAERSTMAFAGTTLTRGTGRLLVTATGVQTQIGRIVEMAGRSKEPRTPLQLRLDRLAISLLGAAAVVCGGLTVLSWLYGEGITDSLLIGVSLAVAAVPEGLPAVATIVLAIGTRQLARRGAIVRRLEAVETLGSTTVICTDKTGTLTENKMTVVRVYECDEADQGGEGPRTSGRAIKVLRAAVLASDVATAATDGARSDPIERAIVAAASEAGISPESLLANERIVAQEPFDAERKRMSVVTESPQGARTAWVKGAPESLLPTLLPGEESVQLEELAQSWGAEGIRVLLVAHRPNLPAKADPECELEALGLIGVSDPPRAAAAASVAAARRAGVRTVMITGDHPQTALAIARATGITTDEHPAVMSTGPQIDSLSDEELRDRSRSANVYARVAPEHKLRIVEALKSQEEVVAMTGDGVNDVPALKAAHIGIAMGRRGSDAATAAADMVLIDDDYSTIVAAIRRGRVIYDNIVRFVHFLLSANAGEVLVFTVAIVLGMSAPLTVLQVLTVNLLTDGLPAVALGGEPPSPNVMERKPRPLREGLLDSIRSRLLIGGAAMGGAAFASFAAGEASGHALGQTMAFTTLVFGQLIYVFSVRGDRWFFEAGQNRALYAAVAITAAAQVAILAVPSVANRFDVVGMSAGHISIALALALLPASILELVKWRSRARMGQ